MRASARTQSSIAVSADGKRWLLINASPDVRAQINANAALQPHDQRRHSGIGAILLMDGQIDHATGLLMLREGDPLTLYCTDLVFDDLRTGLPLLRVLDHYCGVDRHRVPLDRTPRLPLTRCPACALKRCLWPARRRPTLELPQPGGSATMDTAHPGS